MSGTAALELEVDRLRREIVERDASNAALRAIIASLEGKNAALQSSLINHANEIEILKRRLFGPRSERTETSELQLTLGDILEADARLQKELDEKAKEDAPEDASPPKDDDTKPASPPADEPKPKPKPKGRRDLSLSKLPQVLPRTLVGGRAIRLFDGHHAAGSEPVTSLMGGVDVRAARAPYRPHERQSPRWRAWQTPPSGHDGSRSGASVG